jgi:hypothetical protein
MDPMKYPAETGGARRLALPAHGFGEFEVPEMPGYVQSYSKRGNSIDADQTPVYQQARWGNRTGRGGMGGYLSQIEDSTYFEGLPVKLGDHGVFPIERWSPGHDWRGGFGLASLSEVKNYAGIPTRGGSLRKGGPRRGDIVERPGAFFENLRPGISHSRFVQSNDNYAGLYDFKRRTPQIERASDALVLNQMLQNNPFHIRSHAALQADKLIADEFGARGYEDTKAYADHYQPGYAAPARRVANDDPLQNFAY